MLVECIKPGGLVALVDEFFCILMCILLFHDLETGNAKVRQVLVIRGGASIVFSISGHLCLCCTVVGWLIRAVRYYMQASPELGNAGTGLEQVDGPERFAVKQTLK